MATAAAAKDKIKDFTFNWEGKDKQGKVVKGELRAQGEAVVNATLRRQGILVTKVKKQRAGGGGSVTEKDVTLFTRQLATMMKAGVPLLQSFDIVGKGHSNPAVSRLLLAIKTDVETGSSLTQAFRKFPLLFDPLFCNLVGAGEQAGILESLLDRLATYKEKTQAIKSKIKSALFYPVAIIAVAFIITAVIMIFVIPAFKQVFTSFGADLPAPTLFVMAISDAFVKYWYIIFPLIFGAIYGFMYAWKRSLAVQIFMDKLLLKAPVFGHMIRISTIARWTRTLSTMFAAGVPLVEALDSVGGAAGNYVYPGRDQANPAGGQHRLQPLRGDDGHGGVPEHGDSDGADRRGIRRARQHAVQGCRLFRSRSRRRRGIAIQPMEPVIMVVLGTLIGGMVIAMYLPIFKLGQAV